MKQSILLFVAILFSTSSVLAQWGVNQSQIEVLVEAGNPKLTYQATECGAKDLNDLLVYRPYASNPGECVRVKSLPRQAISEVNDMSDEQLVNDSEYDTRITKVYSIEHDGVFSYKQGLSDGQLAALKKSMGIPEKTSFRLELMAPVNGPFDMLNYYLTFGSSGFDLENTYLGQYLKTELQGEPGLHLIFSEEVGLYPGGGINAAYHILMMDKKMVFVKAVFWNS